MSERTYISGRFAESEAEFWQEEARNLYRSARYHMSWNSQEAARYQRLAAGASEHARYWLRNAMAMRRYQIDLACGAIKTRQENETG